MMKKALFSIAAALTLSAATDVHAQNGIAFVSMSSDPAAASDLHARATALFAQPHRSREAAVLLVQAASLRASQDSTAVRDLLDAGRLFAYAKDYRGARGALEHAAARALDFGLVVTAAHAYVDAAFIAVRQKDVDAMRELTSSAERLANSTHVDANQRREIMMRINPERARR